MEILETAKKDTIIGLNLGPSERKAPDIPGIRNALGIPGDPVSDPTRFDINALRPEKPLNIEDLAGTVIYTIDHYWVDGHPNPSAFGIMFNVKGIQSADKRTLFQTMKKAETSPSKSAGGWDSNSFWVCLTDPYATWGLSALLHALTTGQVYIGTTLENRPKMFILMEKEMRPEYLKQIQQHYLYPFGGVS